MADNQMPEPAPGESPETLNSMQILFAHLAVCGTALYFVARWFPANAAPRVGLLVLTILCLVLAAPKLLALTRIRPQEGAALAALVTLAAAFLAICLAAAG
jgi:hypothetical protein